MPPDENNTQTTPPLSTNPGPPPVTPPPPGTPFTPQPVQPATPQPPFQPAAQQPILTTTGDHAGFWIRLAAFYLDFALVSLPVAILSWAIALLAKLAGLGSLGITGILWIPALLVWIFFLYMVATHGATPGKMIFGMKIVKNGQAPGWGGALMREIVGRFVSSLILGIGYIMIAFTQNKRGLHDMIAGTEVVFNTPLGKGKKILAIVVLVLFLILPPLLMGLGVFSVAKFFGNLNQSSTVNQSASTTQVTFEELIEKARVCEPIETKIVHQSDLFGIKVNSTRTYNIKGVEDKRCVLYHKDLEADAEISPGAVDRAKAINPDVTEEQFEQYVASIESDEGSVTKLVGGLTCKFNSNEALVAYLKNIQSDFEGEHETIKVVNIFDNEKVEGGECLYDHQPTPEEWTDAFPPKNSN